MWQKVKNYYHLTRAFVAALYFGFPSKQLTVIGITGTDGKTTTVNMLAHILKSAGKKVSWISSIGATIGDKSYETGLHVTTPNPWQVQKLLSQSVNQRSEYFIIEATSHSLDQNRLAFVDFKIAAITNITHDHLDYHKDRQNYLKSKSKLFKNVNYSILNKDDQSFNDLKARANGKILSYSLRKNTEFNLEKYPLKLKVQGSFNLENALTALSCARVLGIKKQDCLRALNSFQGISGRLETIDLGQSFDVYIDFAHTPSALEKSLKALKAIKNHGKLIAVFGSAGERDKKKRPLLGKVASKFADYSIITAEDPRSEDVKQICSQIARGFNREKDFTIILDRANAIHFAIERAEENDIVGVFGKGHEKSMAFGKAEKPWDEFKIVKNAIKQSLKSS